MTKHELSQLYYLNREIELDKQRLLELESAATSVTSRITGLPHASGISNKTAIAAEMVYLKGKIQSNIDRCFYEYNRLITYINSVDDSLVRQILTCRFINGMSWTQVACSIGGDNTPDGVRMIANRFMQRM